MRSVSSRSWRAATRLDTASTTSAPGLPCSRGFIAASNASQSCLRSALHPASDAAQTQSTSSASVRGHATGQGTETPHPALFSPVPFPSGHAAGQRAWPAPPRAVKDALRSGHRTPDRLALAAPPDRSPRDGFASVDAPLLGGGRAGRRGPLRDAPLAVRGLPAAPRAERRRAPPGRPRVARERAVSAQLLHLQRPLPRRRRAAPARL